MRGLVARSGAGIIVSTSVAAACASFGAESEPSPASVADAGGADGGAGAEAGGPGRWCAQNAPPGSRCFDFDGDEPLGQGWTELEALNGATLARDSIARSPPSAVLLRLPSPGPSEVPRAGLLDDVGTAVSSVALSFDLRVDALGPACETAAGCWGSLAEIVRGDHRVNLYARADSHALIQDYGAGAATSQATLPALPLGAWVRVRILADFTAGALEVDLDGAPEARTSVAKVAGPIGLRVGIGNTNGSMAPWQVRYDNVVIEPR